MLTLLVSIVLSYFVLISFFPIRATRLAGLVGLASCLTKKTLFCRPPWPGHLMDWKLNAMAVLSLCGFFLPWWLFPNSRRLLSIYSILMSAPKPETPHFVGLCWEARSALSSQYAACLIVPAMPSLFTTMLCIVPSIISAQHVYPRRHKRRLCFFPYRY